MTQRDDLLTLCRTLGEPSRDLALSAEGNVSMRLGEQSMTIKASGSTLETLRDEELVDVDIPTILTLLEGMPTDEVTQSTYREALISQTEKMPSVEAILHAVLYDITSTQVIAHTHPVVVNMLTCSVSPHLLVQGALFPDAIVMLGRRQLLIPYTDPGVPLAKAVRDGVCSFMHEEGFVPKVIYLANHGLFVLAESPGSALQITEMVVKNARILHGTLAAGGPAFLPSDQVDRIDRRPDEAYRRNVLKIE